jgi:hypothetical protein
LLPNHRRDLDYQDNNLHELNIIIEITYISQRRSMACLCAVFILAKMQIMATDYLPKVRSRGPQEAIQQ